MLHAQSTLQALKNPTDGGLYAPLWAGFNKLGVCARASVYLMVASVPHVRTLYLGTSARCSYHTHRNQSMHSAAVTYHTHAHSS